MSDHDLKKAKLSALTVEPARSCMAKAAGRKDVEAQHRSIAEVETAGVAPVVKDVANSPGRPLDLDTKRVMESRFQEDFSRVKVHTDGKAADSVRAVDAMAYTVKDDIAFAADRYRPDTRPGQELLAHELAHVVQQGRHQGSVLPSDEAAEQSARRAASDFSQTNQPVAVSGAAAPGLARQKAAGPEKAEPAVTSSVTREAGRTVITINGVAIAESVDASPEELEVRVLWTPSTLNVVIISPEGKRVYPIPGAATSQALLKLSTSFAITLKQKLKVPRATYNEQEGRLSPPMEYETIETLTGERKKGAPPPKKAPAAQPPVAQPVAPGPTPGSAPSAGWSPQMVKPPPVNLDLPPGAKYGKPKTDKEIVEERINQIIKDAMAGKPDIPPLPKGLEAKSVLQIITDEVKKAVNPLLKDLPPDVRKFVLDKIEDAVEKGIPSIAGSAIDAAKLDSDAKNAMKKAVEAGIKMKPDQPRTEQK